MSRPPHGRTARFGGPPFDRSALSASRSKLGRASDAPSPPRRSRIRGPLRQLSGLDRFCRHPREGSRLSRPRTPSTTKRPEGLSPSRDLPTTIRISTRFTRDPLGPSARRLPSRGRGHLQFDTKRRLTASATCHDPRTHPRSLRSPDPKALAPKPRRTRAARHHRLEARSHERFPLTCLCPTPSSPHDRVAGCESVPNSCHSA